MYQPKWKSRSTWLWSGLAAVGLGAATLPLVFGQVPAAPTPPRSVPATPPVAPRATPPAPAVTPPASRVSVEEPAPVDSPVPRPANLSIQVGRVARVDVEDDRLTILVNDNEEMTYVVPEDATIIMNGRPARLQDLQPADTVRVITHRAQPNVAESVIGARVTQIADRPAETSPVRPEERGRGGREQQVARDGDAGFFTQGLFVSREGRVFVAELLPDSPAARAGLRPGDTILIVDRRQVFPADQLGQMRTRQAPLDAGVMVLPDGTFGLPRDGVRRRGVAPGVGVGAPGDGRPINGIPDDSQDPRDPEQPEDPQQPGEPGQPEQPGQPGQPEQPVEPGQEPPDRLLQPE